MKYFGSLDVVPHLALIFTPSLLPLNASSGLFFFTHFYSALSFVSFYNLLYHFRPFRACFFAFLT